MGVIKHVANNYCKVPRLKVRCCGCWPAWPGLNRRAGLQRTLQGEEKARRSRGGKKKKKKKKKKTQRQTLKKN
eukprot:NODE_17222_length_955_cov_2.461353.p4 GENE.NODE_17222_length_955_cov_2.461353~~NODE_17222_length_955_cov_2.461353.p4  ORF type:complete len:73 (+),score=22.68 NODE_17222_length_955_cov_2.461353:671-889(+)